ncbi:MAG: Mov34/MPN/PAD-1 family protein [Myxococcota bacterium]
MARKLTAADALADEAVYRRFRDHAMAWFPKECCGLLVEEAQAPKAILTDNLLDEAHEQDPERFPRTGEDGFLIDGRLVEERLDRGELIAIVHSHVRVGAYFSEEDEAQAMAPWGEPLYPGVEHVVLDAQDDGVKGFRVFAWSEDTGGFVEVGASG